MNLRKSKETRTELKTIDRINNEAELVSELTSKGISFNFLLTLT